MENKVTVVVPLYNHGIYLGKCIESVLKQTYTGYEIIIVDDASTDGSGVVADKIAETDERIKVIHHKENKGLSAARNTGIKAATTEYVLPLDADDGIANNYIERCLEAIDDGLGDQIYTDVQKFGEEEGFFIYPEYCFPELKEKNLFVSCNLYRKKHWEEVGGYDEEMKNGYEDWMFNLKMGHAGHFGYRIAEPLFAYRIKKQSMITETRKKHDEILKQMHKLHPEVFI